jgi:hypothetical protein
MKSTAAASGSAEVADILLTRALFESFRLLARKQKRRLSGAFVWWAVLGSNQ